MDETAAAPKPEKKRRSPGQSLDAEIDRLLVGKTVSYALISLITLCLAMFEWVRWFLDLEASPLWFSLIAALVFVFTYYKVRTYKDGLKRLRLARDGKQVARRYLDRLDGKKYQVVHDLPAGPVKLDHVMVTPHGIFLVNARAEVPRGKDAVIKFDGAMVVVGDEPPDRNPVVDARTSTIWLRKKLKEVTGKDYPVKAVVVYPGWEIANSGDWKESMVWVVNLEVLRKYIDKQPVCISAEEMAEAVRELRQLATARPRSTAPRSPREGRDRLSSLNP